MPPILTRFAVLLRRLAASGIAVVLPATDLAPVISFAHVAKVLEIAPKRIAFHASEVVVVENMSPYEISTAKLRMP